MCHKIKGDSPFENKKQTLLMFTFLSGNNIILDFMAPNYYSTFSISNFTIITLRTRLQFPL